MKSLSLAMKLNVTRYENTSSVFARHEAESVQPILENKDKIKECGL
jgi:hypothetical protein